MSLDIARNIFLRFSACLSSLFLNFRDPSFVTPSTRRPTSSPKSFIRSSSVYSVSSTTSWRSPAIMVSSSMPRSASISATAMGCIRYGSPDLRSCPLCISSATSYALPISSISYFGLKAKIVSRNSLLFFIIHCCPLFLISFYISLRSLFIFIITLFLNRCLCAVFLSRSFNHIRFRCFVLYVFLLLFLLTCLDLFFIF